MGEEEGSGQSASTSSAIPPTSGLAKSKASVPPFDTTQRKRCSRADAGAATKKAVAEAAVAALTAAAAEYAVRMAACQRLLEAADGVEPSTTQTLMRTICGLP